MASLWASSVTAHERFTCLESSQELLCCELFSTTQTCHVASSRSRCFPFGKALKTFPGINYKFWKSLSENEVYQYQSIPSVQYQGQRFKTHNVIFLNMASHLYNLISYSNIKIFLLFSCTIVLMSSNWFMGFAKIIILSTMRPVYNNIFQASPHVGCRFIGICAIV